MRLFLLAILILCLAGAVLAGGTGQRVSTIRTLSEAEVVVTLDGKQPAAPESVRLPYRWDRMPHQLDGRAHFKLRLGAIEHAPDGPMAIYFDRIGNRFETRVNGTLVSMPLSEQSARLDLAKAPRIVIVPQSLLHGDDLIEITIQAQGLRRGGLSRVRFGTAVELEREFAHTYEWRITGSLVVVCVSVVLGMLTLVLWTQQRAPLFLLFGIAEIAWAFRVSDVLIDEPPLSWPTWAVLVSGAYAIYVGLTARLVMLILGIERDWFRTALRIYLLGACVTCVAAYALGYQILWTSWLGLMVVVAMLCAIVAPWVAWKSRKGEHVLLALSVLVSVAVGIRDWVYVWLTPEAFGAASWARYVSILFGVTVAWIIAERFSRATRELSALNQTLTERVAERELQLVASFEQAKEAVERAAALSERQRLMRDMHDGLGSRLTGALSVLRNSKSSNPVAQEYISEALEELKLTVDSLQDYVGDLAPVLGNLRYRLQDRLRAAGVSLIWQVEALPAMEWLTPTSVRSVQNIVLEAIANAIRHGAATKITLAANFDADAGCVEILIHDNGRGFDPTEPQLGRGLTLLKQRAHELGGEATIISHPGRGCRVHVRLHNGLPGPGTAPRN